MISVRCGSFGMLGTNCYLVTEDASGESLLVDCTDYSKRMIDFVGGIGLKYLLLTHGHFDHTAGSARLLENSEAQCVLSDRDSKMIRNPELNLSVAFRQECPPFRVDIPADPGRELYLGETKIDIIPTPGHTPGSVCYAIDRFLFTGDTLMAASIGRTDFPGGSIDDMAESLRRLMTLPEDRILCPGHGRQSEMGIEKKTNIYLRSYGISR